MNNEIDFFTTLTSTLQELNKQVQELNHRQSKTIYTNKEMMKLLDASSATLKKKEGRGGALLFIDRSYILLLQYGY